MSNVDDAPLYADVDDASEAILQNWGVAPDEPTPQDEDELTEEVSEETEEPAEEDEEDQEETLEDGEDPGEEEEPDVIELDDDHIVELVADGETKQASLKDLKRLYGQEASLTRKSQEVAEKRKAAEAALANADHSYRQLLERAEARMKPYQEVDMLVASRQMSPDDFATFREQARAAEEDLKFLQQDAKQFYENAQKQMAEERQKAAQDCVKILQDKLPDWGDDLYNSIRSYAVAQGLAQEEVDQYVDPNVLLLLNKARLYDEGKTVAEAKKKSAKVIRSKQNKTVLQGRKAPKRADGQEDRIKRSNEAVRNLTSSDPHDLAEAMMIRWGEN